VPKSKKKPVQRGRPRRIALTFVKKVPASESLAPASLPLSENSEPAQTTSVKSDPALMMKRDSVRYQQVLRILALRAAGLSDEEIGAELGIKKPTVQHYIYIAGRNGLLTLEDISDPKDQIEYKLLHKVVRNLDAALDSTDKDERARATEKMFDATLASRFAPAAVAVQPQTLVAIRIEQPPGPPQTIREGTIGGVSAFIDADVEKPE